MSDPKLFFASDIHGSERCFRKFLNAASFYRCDVLVMGGDMTGKMLLPVVHSGNGSWSVSLGGRDQVVDEQGLPELLAMIANAGYYAFKTTPEEVRALEQDRPAVDRLFARLMTETIERWLALAAERLEASDTICVLAPGNDDPAFVDDLLSSCPRIINPEHRVVELPGGFQMISCGTSNRTPWDTPREASEEELEVMIEREAARLSSFDRAIFNLHVPPKDTLIDQAILLDEELRPLMRSGSPVIGSVGSSAVRAAIERHQPLLGLHGHVHESRGEARIGRTLALNPGSEYGEGVLRGVIVTLSGKHGVRGYQFVAG